MNVGVAGVAQCHERGAAHGRRATLAPRRATRVKPRQTVPVLGSSSFPLPATSFSFGVQLPYSSRVRPRLTWWGYRVRFALGDAASRAPSPPPRDGSPKCVCLSSP